jgi:uncharacterized protein (DUF433 family)
VTPALKRTSRAANLTTVAKTDALPHVQRDANGLAWVDDTNVKVVEVVMSKQAYGFTPEEMHEQYPHLSLAQIHAALTYYYDHREELDAEIARRAKLARKLRAQTENRALQSRLRKVKKTWTP